MVFGETYRRSARQLIFAGRLGMLAALSVALLASCSGGPRYQGKGAKGEPAEPDREEVVRFAKTFVGTPYRSGGTSYKGTDCSGFVVAVYREFDIRLPRTSQDQSRIGEHIEKSDLKPADLVFFKTSRKKSVSHVGIYIGGGKFIHASTSARKVRIDAMKDDYYRSRFIGARRLLSG